MAQLEHRLPQNIEGDFYVDDTCIDCDACRQIAPATFRDHGGQSSVGCQPFTPADIDRALYLVAGGVVTWLALLALLALATRWSGHA